MRIVSVRFLLVMMTALSVSTEALASFCSSRGDSSRKNLLDIAQSVDAPASKNPPKTIVSGGSSVVATNEQGEEIQIDDSFALTPGATLTTTDGKAKIYIPSTGQTVELSPKTKLKVTQNNKSKDDRICNLSFELQSGRAEFTSDHQAREKNCMPAVASVYEVKTESIEITPIGTKYNVDLNQAIAEANGETYTPEENVGVSKGSVQIRIIKIKKSKSSKAKKDVVASNDEFADEKPIVVKAGRKAKVKKSKKDRLAEIEVIYPD